MNEWEHGGNIYRWPRPMLDFSANLNPLGMPPAVRRALRRAIPRCGAYPDPACTALTAALSEKYGVPAARIVCGNGAAALIYRIVDALRPKRALLLAPTFGEYEKALREAGAACVFCTLTPPFAVGDALEKAIVPGIDMVFLCNPNNPTGLVLSCAQVLQAAEKCRAAGAVLVVDECFGEFLPCADAATVVPALAQLPGVVVLKAFTKLYAMAGLRLGFALFGSAETAALVRRRGDPWSVSTPAQTAGLAALAVPGFAEKTRAYVAENRAFLARALASFGFEVYASQANYLFFRVPRQWAARSCGEALPDAETEPDSPGAQRAGRASEVPPACSAAPDAPAEHSAGPQKTIGLPKTIGLQKAISPQNTISPQNAAAPQNAACPLDEALAGRGILIRSCANYRGLDGRYFRIAVRTRRENRRLVRALRAVCGR